MKIDITKIIFDFSCEKQRFSVPSKSDCISQQEHWRLSISRARQFILGACRARHLAQRASTLTTDTSLRPKELTKPLLPPRYYLRNQEGTLLHVIIDLSQVIYVCLLSTKIGRWSSSVSCTSCLFLSLLGCITLQASLAVNIFLL